MSLWTGSTPLLQLFAGGGGRLHPRAGTHRHPAHDGAGQRDAHLPPDLQAGGVGGYVDACTGVGDGDRPGSAG